MGYALIIGFWLRKLYLNSIIIIVIFLVLQAQVINITREIPYWSYRKMTLILDEIVKDTDSICMLFNPRFEPSKGKKYNSLEFLLLNYYEKTIIWSISCSIIFIDCFPIKLIKNITISYKSIYDLV